MLAVGPLYVSRYANCSCIGECVCHMDDGRGDLVRAGCSLSTAEFGAGFGCTRGGNRSSAPDFLRGCRSDVGGGPQHTGAPLDGSGCGVVVVALVRGSPASGRARLHGVSFCTASFTNGAFAENRNRPATCVNQLAAHGCLEFARRTVFGDAGPGCCLGGATPNCNKTESR